jgi:hypothetical protein
VRGLRALHARLCGGLWTSPLIIDAVATAPEHELTEAARTVQADEAKKEAAHV